MRNYLAKLDRKLLTVIRTIGQEASRKGVSAYVVGGVVRDILLNKRNFDLDIVVEKEAIDLATALSRKWKSKLTVYDQFKTACLELPNGLCIDFAMARKEDYKCSGALPTVRPGNLRDDLFRRDFTINAMAIAINPDCFGRLIDEFGGLEDLLKRKIRVLHDQSFVDDPTRILRAIRFEQRFHFRFDRKTLSLMKTALRKDVVANVKPPRYFAEFKNILFETDPLRCLKRLHDLGGLRFLDSKLTFRFGELSLIHKRIQGLRKARLYREVNYWPFIYFLGLIAGAETSARQTILGKFHFTKNERTAIEQSRNAGEILDKLSIRNMRSSQVYQILKPLMMEVVYYLRVKTSHTMVCQRIDRFLAADMNSKLQINGNDLKRYGVDTGREMGRILEDVLCLKIDRRIKTKQEELNAALLSLGRF